MVFSRFSALECPPLMDPFFTERVWAQARRQLSPRQADAVAIHLEAARCTSPLRTGDAWALTSISLPRPNPHRLQRAWSFFLTVLSFECVTPRCEFRNGGTESVDGD